MDFDKLKQTWYEFINRLNSKGIPLPLVRDPKTGKGDVALTLVFISSIWVQISLIGKLSQSLQGVDMGQALNWFYGCAALYWARKLSKDGTKTTLDESSTDKKDEK